MGAVGYEWDVMRERGPGQEGAVTERRAKGSCASFPATLPWDGNQSHARVL